jgi:hypothetical protein
MSKNVKWVGEHLENLIQWPPKKTAQVYGYSLEYVYTARRRAKLKLKKEDRTMPEQQPQGENEGKLVRSWEAAAYNRETQEWETTTLHSYDHAPEVGVDVPENPFIRQAAPVKITPSKVKPVNRDYEIIGVFGDNQTGYRRINEELVPIHDERAMKVARMIFRDLQPETIVNVGDCIDLAGQSKYEPDSNHFTNTLQASLDRVHSYYAELRADNPNAKIVEVDSNHNVRLGKFVIKQAMDFYGLRRANAPGEWPILTYPYLARLDEVGVEWISGYPAAEYWHSDDLLFIHGREVRSNGSTAELYSKKNPDTNLVFGHVHRQEAHTRTTRQGKYLTAITFGALAKNDGHVPSYGNGVTDRGEVVKHQENWQQGIGVIKDYGDGHYQFDTVHIQDGRAFYNGKEYKAD